LPQEEKPSIVIIIFGNMSTKMAKKKERTKIKKTAKTFYFK
jgi:hypothetical protein